jgi:hypothetical protein
MRYSAITIYNASTIAVFATGVTFRSLVSKTMNKVGSANGIDFYNKKDHNLLAFIPETHPLYNISVIKEAHTKSNKGYVTSDLIGTYQQYNNIMYMVKDIYLKDIDMLINKY